MNKVMIATILSLVLTSWPSGAGWAADPMTGFLEKPGPATQAACPVQGGKINRDLYVDCQGQRVYFCCPECLPTFKKNPERYLQKMGESGMVPEKSPAPK